MQNRRRWEEKPEPCFLHEWCHPESHIHQSDFQTSFFRPDAGVAPRTWLFTGLLQWRITNKTDQLFKAIYLAAHGRRNQIYSSFVLDAVWHVPTDRLNGSLSHDLDGTESNHRYHDSWTPPGSRRRREEKQISIFFLSCLPLSQT